MGTIILWTLLLAGVASAQDEDCFQRGKSITGNPLFKPGTKTNKYTGIASPGDCQVLCQETDGCAWFNWKKTLCYLKSSPEGNDKESKGGVTGPRDCPDAEPAESSPVDESIPESPEVPVLGAAQDIEVDERVLAAADAAVAGLSGVSEVNTCGDIELIGVKKAAKQVVAGTNFLLTLELETHFGEDCSEHQQKICTNIVVFEPLAFQCEDDSGCLELTNQEDITCEEVVDAEEGEDDIETIDVQEEESNEDIVGVKAAFKNEEYDGLITVKTFLGSVKGKQVSLDNGKLSFQFLGIPYAEPPVGSLRFMPPQPKTAWGTIETTEFGAECPQMGFLPHQIGQIVGEENCLFLNVYTPQIPSDSEVHGSHLKPVMLWIHGGGFTSGSANFYDPSLFVEKDVVVVSINYRHGVLGMMTFGNNLVSGNMGLKDQHMAIKWVKKHIHHFGGDSNKITLFGESAGGISVHAQIISPYNKDLLAGGISQSGTMLYRNIVSLNRKELEQKARKVSELVECEGKDLNQNVLECLQAVPAEDLISKTNSGLKWPKDLTKESIQEFRENLFQWDPVVDYYSEKPFLPMSPLEAIKSKSYNQIPFISGTNKDDGALFLSFIYENLNEVPASWDSLGAGWLGLTRTSSEVQLSSENILLANIMRKYYTGNDFNIEDENLSNLSNMLGDGVFLSPDQKSVSLMARGDAPVFNYMLSYRGTNTFATLFGLDSEKDFGVMHGDDLLYLFKNDLFPRVFENEDEEKLSNYMVTFWTNFAKFGEPTPFHSDESVYWKPVGNGENNYMDLKPEPELKQNVATERMRFWERLIWATREKDIDRKILLKKVQKFFWSNRISTR